MLTDLLRERERGFEADYFNKRDAKLIQKIRERAHLQEVAAALAEKLQVDAPALLQRAAGLGLTRETGAALLVAPLVQVAWADGDVTDRERAVVLELAAARGVVAGTPPYTQLFAWLQECPEAELFDTAIEIINAGFAVLPAAERADRVRAVIDACERVAEASGGVAMLGLRYGASGAEAAVLETLTRKLYAPHMGTD
jgi:tellurite resistance protein